MTRQETGKFLDELTTLYPNVLRKEINMGLMGNLWEEALKDYSYKDIHEALQDYFRGDIKGYVPTAGQLIDLIDDGYNSLRPDDHVFLE